MAAMLSSSLIIVVALLACNPDMVQLDGHEEPELEEYKLNIEKYNYTNSYIKVNNVYIYIDKYMRYDSDTTIYRFSDSGIFQYKGVPRVESASVFSDPRSFRYGVYGVEKDSVVVLEGWNKIDHTFQRTYGTIRNGEIHFYKRKYIPWGAESDIDFKLVPRDLDHIDQYPLVYPGQRPDNE